MLVKLAVFIFMFAVSFFLSEAIPFVQQNALSITHDPFLLLFYLIALLINALFLSWGSFRIIGWWRAQRPTSDT